MLMIHAAILVGAICLLISAVMVDLKDQGLKLNLTKDHNILPTIVRIISTEVLVYFCQ